VTLLPDEEFRSWDLGEFQLYKFHCNRSLQCIIYALIKRGLLTSRVHWYEQRTAEFN
jgi:hypothetical protein